MTSDTLKPTVASVGSLFKQVVEVRLSEPVTKASAETPTNYELRSSAGADVAVSSAVQDPSDAAHVTFQTAALPETDLMQLVVQNLADLSLRPMPWTRRPTPSGRTTLMPEPASTKLKPLPALHPGAR